MTNFEICQLLATPGPFKYFGQNWVSSENQFFLDEGVTRFQCVFGGGGGLSGQVTKLYDGTIGGGETHLGGSSGALKTKVAFFLTHL